MAVPLATLHPSTVEFESIVTRVHPDGWIELRETYFYPLGGGQPDDTGMLLAEGGPFPVLEVRKRDGAIVHRVDGALREGQSVTGRVDPERRGLHRRMHTAMHVLCAVLERHEGTKITGNQIGAVRSRLDVDTATFDKERFLTYVGEANALIGQGIPVHRYVASRQALRENPSLVKLAAGFPESVEEIHIVEIPGVDAQPCGGTHVDHTHEIGEIVFLKAENRGKENRRIYFTIARR